MRVFDERPLRVLAADDSAVMRGIMRTLFIRHAGAARADLPRMELVGVSRDGIECLEAIAQLNPDVLVLDLEMPRMSGLDVLDELRKKHSNLPVIMCSSHTEVGARATLDALSRGASDYVMKPTGQRDFESSLCSLSEQLLPRIAALAITRRQASVIPSSPLVSPANESVGKSASRIEVLVIGVSTGGPAALEQLLPQLPADFPVPVLIVQHMPKVFTGVLAERLDRCCRLRVSEAVHGAPVLPGTVCLAPGDMHMEIMPRPLLRAVSAESLRGFAIKLHRQEPLNHCRPSVDYLFRSAAHYYADATLALVLTGMGSDGLEGAQAIHSCGGTVLAQDEASSAVWGMPGRIAESGIATALLPLSAIGREINQRVNKGRIASTQAPLYPTTPAMQQEGAA